MSCAIQIFENGTQARLDCLTQKANSAGTAIGGDAGQASKDGIAIR